MASTEERCAAAVDGVCVPKNGEGEGARRGSNIAAAELSAAELVAKARAPVKKEFLRKHSERLSIVTEAPIPDVAGSKDMAASKVSDAKKSKRQQKKERQLIKKSAENICSAVAKANDVNACPYGKDCRFNHELAAFLAQKPPDLPGKCHFLETRRSCPFGAACRFAGTHSVLAESALPSDEEEPEELNNLKKDVQKSLWKNHALFPRADARLISLGILGKGQQKTSNQSTMELTEASMEIDGVSKAVKVVDKVEVQIKEATLIESKEAESAHIGGQNEEDTPAMKKAKADSITPLDAEQLSVNISANTLSCDDTECRLTNRERKVVDFKNKLYVAPLTTVGNLPFRRVCKQLGADITCGEMAMCTNLLQGQASEWALLRRHRSEDIFGVQICGAYPDTVARTAEMIERESEIDFIDINVGCPIDLVVNKGAGSCLLTKPSRLRQIVMATSASLDSPLTVKVRTGYYEGKNCVQSFIGDLQKWGASALTIHGRTRQQRYSKLADWDYIYKVSQLASENLQVVGNGDIFSYTDWNEHVRKGNLSTCMLARGVLIKPWLLAEIKEQRHWDISAAERFDILKDYVRYGLLHWGSDSKGVETTRHFLLEWLSYMHRYIPVGLLDVVPQKLNWRPPLYYGRNDLETLLASDSAADWVRISEMLLGPSPAGFSFTPRHKSNAYDRPENG